METTEVTTGAVWEARIDQAMAPTAAPDEVKAVKKLILIKAMDEEVLTPKEQRFLAMATKAMVTQKSPEQLRAERESALASYRENMQGMLSEAARYVGLLETYKTTVTAAGYRLQLTPSVEIVLPKGAGKGGQRGGSHRKAVNDFKGLLKLSPAGEGLRWQRDGIVALLGTSEEKKLAAEYAAMTVGLDHDSDAYKNAVSVQDRRRQHLIETIRRRAIATDAYTEDSFRAAFTRAVGR